MLQGWLTVFTFHPTVEELGTEGKRTHERGKADLKWGPEKGDPSGHLFFSQVQSSQKKGGGGKEQFLES